MYHKAILFWDQTSANKIMKTKMPRKQKALGRKVSGFKEEIWNRHRQKIVEDGNWYKFTNAIGKTGLAERLLETGDRLLVEVGETMTVA